MNLTTLVAIRRKVDKATKRADALQSEFASGHGPLDPACDKHVLGANPLKPDYFVVKGQYSEIFPASVGESVADLVLPRPILTAQEAACVAARHPRKGYRNRIPAIHRLHALRALAGAI